MYMYNSIYIGQTFLLHLREWIGSQRRHFIMDDVQRYLNSHAIALLIFVLLAKAILMD